MFTSLKSQLEQEDKRLSTLLKKLSKNHPSLSTYFAPEDNTSKSTTSNFTISSSTILNERKTSNTKYSDYSKFSLFITNQKSIPDINSVHSQKITDFTFENQKLKNDELKERKSHELTTKKLINFLKESEKKIIFNSDKKDKKRDIRGELLYNFEEEGENRFVNINFLESEVKEPNKVEKIIENNIEEGISKVEIDDDENFPLNKKLNHLPKILKNDFPNSNTMKKIDELKEKLSGIKIGKIKNKKIKEKKSVKIKNLKQYKLNLKDTLKTVKIPQESNPLI